MNNPTEIISTFIAIIAFIVMFRSYTSQVKSETSAKFFLKTYRRPVSLIPGTVEKIIWNGEGTYSCICQTKDAANVIIPLSKELINSLNTNDLCHHLPFSVFLMEYTLFENNYYKIAPIPLMEVGQVQSKDFLPGYDTITNAQADKLFKTLKCIDTANKVLMLVSGISIFIFPRASSILSLLSYINNSINCNFSPCFYAGTSCIIKNGLIEKETSKMADKKKKSFASDTENYIAGIEKKVDSNTALSPAIITSIKETISNTAANFDPDKIVQCCHNCGCISNKDDTFCAQCGQKLSNSTKEKSKLSEQTSLYAKKDG